MTVEHGTLDALRTELGYAKQLAPGGQKSDPGRVAAIEAQIEHYENAGTPEKVAAGDKSNESTDYQSDEVKVEDKVKSARAKSKPETTDETETRETTDA